MQAILTPLMSGNMPVKERILCTLRLLKQEETNLNREELDKLHAVLYAFAVEFLEHDDLLEVTEALRMTVLGEMIWEDGYQCCELQQICKKLKRGLAIPQIALEIEKDVSYVEKSAGLHRHLLRIMILPKLLRSWKRITYKPSEGYMPRTLHVSFLHSLFFPLLVQ